MLLMNVVDNPSILLLGFPIICLVTFSVASLPYIAFVPYDPVFTSLTRSRWGRSVMGIVVEDRVPRLSSKVPQMHNIN